MTTNEKTIDTKEIYSLVFKIDAHIKTLRLACLQIERDDFADVAKTIQSTNWEIHDVLENAD